MKLRFVIWLIVLTACVPLAGQGKSITITKMDWVDVAGKLLMNPSADIVYVNSGGGNMDDAIKIIRLIGDRKVICKGQCVSAAAFVVVCGNHEWENRGELWFHTPEYAGGGQSERVNQWLADNCDLPDLSKTTKNIGWSVRGNDLSDGTLREWNK